MDAPLYNEIVKYSKEMTSFHMPGHKAGNILKMKEICYSSLDVTEVPGLDNLYEAEGVILEAEEKMAAKYGAKESIFVTNGSTAGIIASILTVCNPGDSLLISRNCHHSVWNALILGGVKPIYINPGYDKTHNVLGGICPNELERLLINNPETKGLIIVSPTYEGLVSDVEALANVVDKYNKILIVDEAHGAHFAWHTSLPRSATRLGADITIQSMHKTLPSLTQSGLLHIGVTSSIGKDALTKRLQMIQTSSPSYVMMGIMDYARAQMEEQTDLWEKYVCELIKTRKRLGKLKNLIMLSRDICGRANIYDIDESKIVIYTYNTNITGIKLGKILRSKYNIQVEVEAKDYIIAMSTVADTAYDLELLSNALLEIDSSLKQTKQSQQYSKIADIKSSHNFLPREIYFGDKEYIPIEQSVGRISAVNIMLYPPGIPLICIGEVFSRQLVDQIRVLADQVLGIINEKDQIKVSVSKKGENYEG